MTYNIIEGQWYGNMKAIERVKILTEDIDPETKTAIPRPAQDIVMDILDTYEKLGRSKRRALVRAMRRMHRE